MVLCTFLLSIEHQKVRPRKYGQFMNCQLQNVTGWDAISMCLNMVFRCGSTISATSRHYHTMTEIMMKDTLNQLTLTPMLFCNCIPKTIIISCVTILNNIKTSFTWCWSWGSNLSATQKSKAICPVATIPHLVGLSPILTSL